MKKQRLLPIYQPWRFLFILTLLFCFLSFSSRTLAFIITGVLIVIIIALFCLSKRYFQLSMIAIFSCVVCFAVVFSGYTFHYKDQKLLKYADQTVHAVIVIDEVLYDSKSTTTYLCDIQSCNGEQTDGKIQMAADSESAFVRGEVISCDLVCTLPEEYSFSFPNRLYQRSQGVLLEASLIIGSEQLIDYESRPIRDAIYRLQNALSQQFNDLDHDSASLLRALLLGDRSGISTVQKRDFAKIGASHILAISGLHFSIVCGLGYWLLSKLFLSKRIRCISYILFSIFFCLLCGCSPSAMRACAMLLLATLLSLFYMEDDPLSVLSFVGVLFLCVEPHYILNISFLLSYSAAFGILYFLPNKEKKEKEAAIPFWKRLGRKTIHLLLPSAAAFLFTLPFTAFFFQKASLFSVVSSLFLIPLCTLCIYSGILTLLLPSFLMDYGVIQTILCAPTKLFLFLVERLSDHHDITIFLQSDTVRHGMILFTIFLCVFLIFFSKCKKTLLVSLLLIATISFSVHQIQMRPQKEEGHIYLYTLYDASVILIQVKDHHALIVDDDASYLLLKSAMEDYTKRFETDHIDSLILCDYSMATIASLKDFCEEYYVNACYYQTPNQTADAHLLKEAFSPSKANLITYETNFQTNELSFVNHDGNAFVCSLYGYQIGYFSDTWKYKQRDLILLDDTNKNENTILLFFERDAKPSHIERPMHLLFPSTELKLAEYPFSIR